MLLAESPTEVAVERARILAALGDNAGMATALLRNNCIWLPEKLFAFAECALHVVDLSTSMSFAIGMKGLTDLDYQLLQSFCIAPDLPVRTE